MEISLITMAEIKYKGLVHTGERNAPSKEQYEIMAPPNGNAEMAYKN